ncbi:MAG: Ig-like domain-containing protein, partial [Proteobacteria bacterium]|nr:Ig-like domain-containing protein [Pseudomonadota bacterium]
MSASRSRSTLALVGLLPLLALAACGRQVVEFALDDATNGQTDAHVGDAFEPLDAPGLDAPPSELAPVVVSTVPAPGSIGVALDTVLAAQFSKPMDAASLATAFVVRHGLTPVYGVVVLDLAKTTLRFTPNLPLINNLVYTATITTAARDTTNLALAANYVWTFTTANNALPPVVISTTPPPDAMNVSITKKPTATFSKAMDPTTISALTFTLRQGLTVLPGAVTLNSLTNTATFDPTAPLMVGLVYTATITTGARDTGGKPLAIEHAWSFTTDACGQAPIVLGAAGDFAVLAGSTVTNTGLTTVSGDLGVSPGTAVTGFPPGILVGTQHTDPTSATAIANLTTAYNEAAGRTACAVTVAGNLG